MSVSRRKFVRGATLAGLAAGLPLGAGKTEAQPVTAPPINPQPPSGLLPQTERLPDADPLEAARYLKQSMFSGSLNTKFKAGHVGRKSVVLELIEVNDTSVAAKESSAKTSRQETFSLTFRGPLEQALRQKTYTLHHDQIGRFALFLAPAGQDTEARYYQAVFNRLSPYDPDHPARHLSPPRRRQPD